MYKDFQQLMEQVYGPHYGLGRKVEEESARIAKELVDNAVEEVKEMTNNKQTPLDIIEIDGIKYKRIEEPQSFYDKVWELLKTKLGDTVDCDEMADQVVDLIRRHIPSLTKNKFMSEYLSGYNEAIKQVKRNLFGELNK